MNDAVKKAIVAYKVLSKMHNKFNMYTTVQFSIQRPDAGRHMFYCLIQKQFDSGRLNGLAALHAADFIVSDKGLVQKSRIKTPEEISNYIPTELELTLYG